MHPGGGDNHTVGRVPQKLEKGHLFCNLYREWQNTKHGARLQVAEEFVQAKPPPKWAFRGKIAISSKLIALNATVSRRRIASLRMRVCSRDSRAGTVNQRTRMWVSKRIRGV